MRQGPISDIWQFFKYSKNSLKIGSGHFIGVSGAAGAGGIAVAHFEFNVS